MNSPILLFSTDVRFVIYHQLPRFSSKWANSWCTSKCCVHCSRKFEHTSSIFTVTLKLRGYVKSVSVIGSMSTTVLAKIKIFYSFLESEHITETRQSDLFGVHDISGTNQDLLFFSWKWAYKWWMWHWFVQFPGDF
jgi:hypothetical protein